MTREHFEHLSQMLGHTRTYLQRTEQSKLLLQFDDVFVPLITDALLDANPKLSRERFIAACRVPGEGDL